jgi:glutamate formiminotransferase / formiminotetrahydrofolate cyclodeaminase
MQRLLESVPNFSEGRRPEVVEGIVDAARSVEGVHVLDLHSDADHNRTVLTLAGESEALVEAVFRAMERATETIDLRQHSGEHPRVGATDVVPFIPLGTTSMAEAVEAARSLGERVAQSLHIPVYFYEEAATRPERQNLEAIRRKGFEELRDIIALDLERQPDLGPAAVHPSAGAVVVGARGPLIAYNIYLNSNDVRIAKAIARAIRHSSGGLRYVKALGLEIPARGQVQVSMNLTNYRKSGIFTVFELVRALADSYGATITDSEVVGLVPMEALVDSARHYLRMHDFASDQILESKLLEG